MAEIYWIRYMSWNPCPTQKSEDNSAPPFGSGPSSRSWTTRSLSWKGCKTGRIGCRTALWCPCEESILLANCWHNISDRIAGWCTGRSNRLGKVRPDWFWCCWISDWLLSCGRPPVLATRETSWMSFSRHQAHRSQYTRCRRQFGPWCPQRLVNTPRRSWTTRGRWRLGRLLADGQEWLAIGEWLLLKVSYDENLDLFGNGSMGISTDLYILKNQYFKFSIQNISIHKNIKNSPAGSWTRVSRVRTWYTNRLYDRRSVIVIYRNILSSIGAGSDSLTGRSCVCSEMAVLQ